MEQKTFEPIPPFKIDSCKGCKGHSNAVLECDFTKEGDRNLLVKILDNYIQK